MMLTLQYIGLALIFMLASGCGDTMKSRNPENDLVGKIAFTSGREAKGDYKLWQIFVMNADGTDQRNISFTDKSVSHPKWSPDGKKIAFDGPGFAIWTMDDDGTNARKLTGGISKGGSDKYPAWSPDGKKIAFVSSREEDPKGPFHDGLYIINADGTDERKLFSIDGLIGSPCWLADGKKIVFDRSVEYGENSRLQIFICNQDGTGMKQLTFDQEHPASDPTWSPDGNKIAFIRGGAPTKIWVMNADGSNQKQITKKRGQDSDPAWSPDGSKIVFSSVRKGFSPWWPSEIYVINANGTNERQITKFKKQPDDDKHPDWWAPKTNQK